MNLSVPIDVAMLERQTSVLADLLRKHKISENEEIWGLVELGCVLSGAIRSGYRIAQVQANTAAEVPKNQL